MNFLSTELVKYFYVIISLRKIRKDGYMNGFEKGLC